MSYTHRRRKMSIDYSDMAFPKPRKKKKRKIHCSTGKRKIQMLLKRDRQTACNRTSIMKTRMRQNVRKQKRIAVQMRTAQRKAQQRKTQRMRRTKVLQMIQIRQPQQEAANQIHRLQAASRSQSAAVTVLIQWQESCTKPDLSVM